MAIQSLSSTAGKLVQAQVSGIAHKRPQGDQLDQANPVRDDETGLWQCPFCHSKEFPELSDVGQTCLPPLALKYSR